MKKGLFLLFLSAWLCGGCYDELSNIGQGPQPPGDRIGVYVDTVRFSARTVESGPVYARAINSQLGELYTPIFGNFKANYICQFYLPPEFSFPYGMIVDDKIEGASLDIYYNSTGWTGDPYALMQVEVNTLKKQLKSYFYTDTNLDEYVEKTVGKRSYTAANHAKDSLVIPLDVELGKQLYEESKREGVNAFDNQSLFNAFFPGLYITTSGGVGSILNVQSTILRLHYKLQLKDKNGNDSTIVASNSAFSATQEVIQLNSITNDKPADMLRDTSFTYLKTPAGVYTMAKLPVRAIVENKKSGKAGALNLVNFTLKTYPPETDVYNFPAPGALLMIEPDSIKEFFERGRTADSKNAFLAFFDSTSLTYNFGNISAFVDMHYTKLTGDSVEMALVPVKINTDANGSITSIRNYIGPAMIRIRKDGDHANIRVISSKF